MDLTQLEGFKPTELELTVFNNPSFQFLRNHNWPFRWGELATGLKIKTERDYYGNEVVAFETTDARKLSPHAIGKHFDEIASHIRSIYILIAKLARDTNPENEIDRGLVHDFILWLDDNRILGYSAFKGFRWERHITKLEKQKKQQAKEAKLAGLMQGDANVIVILASRLSENERDYLKSLLVEGCVTRGVFPKDSHFNRSLHLPRIDCIQCENHRQKKEGHSNNIVMVDCGDVSTIMKVIPKKMQKLVKPVRFSVPKDAFRECMGDTPVIRPYFLLYTFEQEDTGIDITGLAKRSLSLMEHWLKDRQESQPQYYSYSQIIRPTGRQRLHAVIWIDAVGNAEGIIPQEDPRLSVNIVGERF